MESIGGYRLVRRLGAGLRAEVWLGHVGSTSDSSASSAVAVKVFNPKATIESIESEIESLGRASSRHLLRLEDLALAPQGLPVLILQRLSALHLGRLLANSRRLSAGEIVTILAPIVLAVSELHRVGVTHGKIQPTSVMFDDNGAPVLACFGAATLFAEFPEAEMASALSPAAMARVPAVVSDREALYSLCRLVLERGDKAVEPTLAWLSSEVSGGRGDLLAEELADRLFCLAEARPVSWNLGVDYSEIVNAGRKHFTGWEGAAPTDIVPLSGQEAIDTAESRFNRWPGSRLLALSTRLTKLLWPLTSRMRDALAPVRKPVWIVASIILVSLVLALVFIPNGSGSEGINDFRAAAEVGSASDTGTGDSVAHRAPTAQQNPELVERAITGDDPVVAAKVLLKLRETCLRTMSLTCLDGADQSGSAIWDADRFLIRTAQQGGITAGEVEYSSESIALIERMGNTALLTVSGEPESAGSRQIDPTNMATAGATLLLIRGSAGWRIRDLLPETRSISGY